MISVNLTFHIQSVVLYAARLLNLKNISTKLYENTTMIWEVTAWTRSHGRTDTQPKLQIVATVSRLLQADSTKMICDVTALTGSDGQCTDTQPKLQLWWLCLTHRKRARQKMYLRPNSPVHLRIGNVTS